MIRSAPVKWFSLVPPRARLALGIYVACTVMYLAFMGVERLTGHSPYNHFAHLADAWAHGRQDIVQGGPSYAHGNDFAEFNGKTYISFPPFPALLMLPFVALAGSPEEFADGQFVGWLAGIAPAMLFVLLERLRDFGLSRRTQQENVLLVAAYALGTVYFFSAVQGTVWFTGHVVGSMLLVLYLNAALGARHPLLAGLALGAIWHTRPTMALTGFFFVFELWRINREANPAQTLKLKPLVRPVALFGAPIAAALLLAVWTNHSRFGSWSPAAFGHEHLAVAWHARMQRWGLFHYHYLAKNLGVMLTSLPWMRPPGMSGAPFQINEHGLALWFTTPLYLWLFVQRDKTAVYWSALAAAIGPLTMNLLYQNSGWSQFGYRFSNDYAPLLFVMLAVGGVRLGNAAKAAVIWGIGWNAFGAMSFNRDRYRGYYFSESSQEVLYQKD